MTNVVQGRASLGSRRILEAAPLLFLVSQVSAQALFIVIEDFEDSPEMLVHGMKQ